MLHIRLRARTNTRSSDPLEDELRAGLLLFSLCLWANPAWTHGYASLHSFFHTGLGGVLQYFILTNHIFIYSNVYGSSKCSILYCCRLLADCIILYCHNFNTKYPIICPKSLWNWTVSCQWPSVSHYAENNPNVYQRLLLPFICHLPQRDHMQSFVLMIKGLYYLWIPSWAQPDSYKWLCAIVPDSL